MLEESKSAGGGSSPSEGLLAAVRCMVYAVWVPPSATAERIARAALTLLEKESAEAVTMRRVARMVGISPMAIYHHFPSRDALLKSVTDREFEKLVNWMQARPKRGSAKSRVLSVMDYYLNYALARPRIFEYVFSQHRTDARRFPTDFRARRSPTLTPVADTLSKAMDTRILRRDDVWEIAFGLWAHVHGYVALYRAGRIALSEKEFRALCHRSIQRFFRGLYR